MGLMAEGAQGQTAVFTDDFSTNQSTSYTTTGSIGSSAWSVTRSGDDWGARRNTSPAQLELTNDASATANANGWTFASTSTSAYASPYNTTLNLNPRSVIWTFNMRQIRSDPAGFASGSYGVAFILGGTSTTAATAGNGYAVVLGQSGSTDPIRLVKYTNGLQGTMTNLVVSNTSGLTDFGSEYLSVKVTYNPANSQWELFLRNDGGVAFTDPTTGTLVTQGTATDNTYTGISLTVLGAYWQGSTGANQTAFFDNVTVRTGVDGTITSAEYGTHTDGQNQQTSGSSVWYMNWDNGNLYVGISNATIGEGAVLYLDKDPQAPVNDGTDANGTNVGRNYDGTNFAALQFRADLVVYFKNGYREYRTADGSNGWNAATTGFGSYADNGGTNTRELAIPWSVIGGMPSSFNWFGYVTSSGGFVFAQVPTENMGGSIGTGARYERYFTVSTTNIGSETKPFSRNSFVFNNTADESGFGSISVYDFTMNSSGRTITRGSGVWTIAGNLRIDAGTISFGSTSDAANVTGNLVLGGTLTLSSSIGGDINVGGNWTRSGGTFTPNSRAVTFNGSANQSVTGTTTFDYLTISNSGGNITLNNDIDVNQNLTFNAGNVVLGTSKVFLGTSATITGAAAGKCVVTNSTGALYRNIAPGGSFQFAVGPSTTLFNPVSIALNPLDAGSELFNVRVIDGVSPSAPDNSLCVQRSWDISESTPGGNSAALTFQWAAADEGPNFARSLSSTFHYSTAQSRYFDVAFNTPATGSNPYSVSTVGGYPATEFSVYIVGASGGLPVQLSSFTGTITTGNRVRLDWRTISELNNYGFHVQRRFAGGASWGDVPNSFIPGHGTTSVPQQYTFTDNTPLISATEYRLKQVDLDGTENFSEPITVDNPTSVVEPAPKQFALLQNYPNPFNPTTEIKFSVAETDAATLVVYNSVGQKVAALYDQVAEAGRYYKVTLDGRNLSSGMYFYRLTSGKQTDLKKLMLIK